MRLATLITHFNLKKKARVMVQAKTVQKVLMMYVICSRDNEIVSNISVTKIERKKKIVYKLINEDTSPLSNVSFGLNSV